MNLIKKTTIAGLFLLLFFGMACKEKTPTPSGPTDREVLLETLTTSTWVYSETSSSVSGVLGTFNMSDATLTVTETTAGVSFTLGGEISESITGGSIDIAEDLTISNVVLNYSNKLSVTAYDVRATEFAFIIELSVDDFNTGGKTNGIGSHLIVFSAI
ncbi:MAG: hypothetical protein ABFS32_08965 [Bacteroidota bacterium]